MTEPMEKFEGMEEMEELLRKALKRIPPPSGLEQRILAAVKSVPPRRKFNSWLLIAASLFLVVSVSGFLVWRHYRIQQAKEQLIMALQFTSQTIDLVFETALQEVRDGLKPIRQEEIQ